MAILCLSVSASAYDFEIDGLYYVVNQDQNSCTVVKHPSGTYSGNIEIPPFVFYRGRELSVNTIGQYCFCDCRLNSLTIPRTVTIIEGWALANSGVYDSPYIDKLVLQDSEQAISFLADGSAVYSDDIEVNEIYIGRSCKGGQIAVCNGSISFGNTPMVIETPIYIGTLENNIDTIIIPESVYKISLNTDYSFNSNPYARINNLIISDSAQELDISGYISRITNLYVGRDIQNLPSKDVDEIKFGPSLKKVPVIGNISLKSIALPPDLISIPDRFLSGCWGLSKIFIPKSVVDIGTGAFQNCGSLQFISLPNASEIPDDCFNGCSNLQFIEGSDGIIGIGENAFANTGLTSFNISENLKDIKSNAFYGAHLKDIYISSNNFTYASDIFSNLNYLENIYYLPSPKEYQDKLGFSNLNYREANLIVKKDAKEKFKDIEPWKNFWMIDTFSDIQNIKFRNEIIGGEIGTGILITEILDIKSQSNQFDYSTFELKSTDNKIVSVNWPYIYFNGVGKCKILLSQKLNPEIYEIQVVVKDYLPKEFEVDKVKYRRLEGYNVEVIEINTEGKATIPTNVEYEDIPFTVIKMNAQIGNNVTSLSIPKTCKEILSINAIQPSTMRELIIDPSDASISIGRGKLQLSNSITPFPNPSDVEERRTGFRNGYYEGLFYELPIERLVISRNIELPKYYERTLGTPTSSYSTVYDDLIYYPPFYGLKDLKYVEIGENVSAICKNQIEAVVNAVPTTMEYTNFGKCDNIEVVVSNSPNAPIGGGFSQVTYESASLFLPNGGADSYKSDDYWKKFAHISEATIIPIESISFESDEVTMDINDSKLLHPIINPSDASIKTLKWSSSKPSIVNVSEDGVITTSSREGEAIITASACDGTNLSASIKIIVQEGAGISEVLSDARIDISVENGRLYIRGKHDTDTVSIYNVQGQLVISTYDNEIGLSTKGIYIIKVDSICKKIIL